LHPINATLQEVDKFGKLASLWWDPHGPMRSLHAVNPLRTDFISRVTDPRDKRVLDVGCGAGLLSESLARLGAKVTGIDLSSDLLDTARVHAGLKGLLVAYRHLSVEHLAEQQPESFDMIVCMEVLEHVPKPESVVAACTRLLKPGGDAFFSTIDQTAKSWLFAIVGAEYILRLLPAGSHHYRGFIKPAQLQAWTARHGLDYLHPAGISYNLLTRQFTLVESLDINYMMHFRKPYASNR
jgi:2-polyprenyl-6-hydroxyphenyl methylase/3-demethylubiquinone-9 3-methyltransferase